jgi:CelD/BcsL family acetyltransferase involved in cellulose biosynthesis
VSLEAEWRRLAERSRNVFATWELAQTWWEHVAGDAEERYVTDDDVVVPLVIERRGPLRLLRFVGHGVSDEQGPICAPEARQHAATLVRRVLERGGWDVFAAELLPRDEAWGSLGAQVVSRPSSPVLRFQTRDWDEYLASRSRNFRQLIRKTARRLEDATFRLADAASLEQDLDTLFALHRARWPRGSDFLRYERFHRAFARVALDRGWLRLWLVEVDREPAGAWYGFRYGNVQSYYQAGRDERFDALGVGIGLLAHTVREAQEAGCSEYRFLQGDEPLKFRFTDDDSGLVTLAAARGALGRAALSARVLATRARRSWRRARSLGGGRRGG